MPPQIAKDYKDFKTFKDARIELISRHPEWYNTYHKSITDQMVEPRPITGTPTPENMTEYINSFLLPKLHQLKRDKKLIPSKKATVRFHDA